MAFKYFSRNNIGSGGDSIGQSKPSSIQIEQNELSSRTAEYIRRFGVIVGQKGPMDASHGIHIIQR